MAKPKSKTPTTPRAGGKHISNARHTGRTFCQRCGTKIAFGMKFCNRTCRDIYTRAG